MHPLLARLLDMLDNPLAQTSSATASLERSLVSAHRAHTLARRALAIALAEEARETERRAILAAKVEDLEKRTVEALRAGREDLGLPAAEAIAAMATDINAS